MTISKGVETEASVLCYYLTGQKPSRHIVELYNDVVLREVTVPSKVDWQIMSYALRHPKTMAMLDGALALLDPDSLLRLRLYAMFAICEATPEYAKQFLPAKHGPFYIITAGLVGVRAVLRTLAGAILIKLIQYSA
jgi:hypothetical protein